MNFLSTINWELLSIPMVAAFVGWITNVIAIKMTFYPLEYWGVKPFGWQGIIPSKAGKMAGKAVYLLTSKVIDVEALFAQLDPERVAQEMKPVLKSLSREIIDQSMREQVPRLWKRLPDLSKEMIYIEAATQFPAVVERMMREIKTNIRALFDIRRMMTEGLMRDKKLLNEIFLRCGAKEFKFIKHSGIYFGLLFGILQMFLWMWRPCWWILPLGGLVVGYATNWLALKLIFRPLHPVRFGPLVLQGLFIKRQKEVSREYAKIIATRSLTVENIFNFVLKEGPSDLLVQLTTNQVRKGVDDAAGFKRVLLKVVAGSKKYNRIRDLATQRFVEKLPGSIYPIFRYTEEALDIENTLSEKLAALPPHEYEGTLRPAFEEDEMTLILVGAALGFIAGWMQLLAMM